MSRAVSTVPIHDTVSTMLAGETGVQPVDATASGTRDANGLDRTTQPRKSR
jgi:hypothetical protein